MTNEEMQKELQQTRKALEKIGCTIRQKTNTLRILQDKQLVLLGKEVVKKCLGLEA